ncbi:MAG: Tm-1-like ATP-binding domain-containing protein [Bryobacteraceae bacterium]
MKTVVTAGAFDTKGPDYEFLIHCLRSHGLNPLTVDFGVLEDPAFTPDVTSADVAQAAGVELVSLRQSKDKTRAMRTMAEGLPRILSRLYRDRRLDGVCGMGGSGGTTILSAGMRGLPIGVPKLLISTVASGDVSAYVGTADVTLMNSVVDVAGLNRISREIYTNAAAAIAGMVQAVRLEPAGDRPIVAASMFGNTTACIDRARALLDRAGWEVLVFHATGNGGKVMQRLASEGLLAGLLDLTTTELADEVCGGIFSAGPERVQIGASRNIPVVLAPGCVDMCNFGPLDTVPSKYRSRLLYEWNVNVTLLRTNVEENRRIGGLIAETANRCRGPVAVLLPLRGVSMLDSQGQRFRDEAADDACFEAIRARLRQKIRLIEVDSNINDPSFADRATQVFLELSGQPGLTASQTAGSKILL